MAFIHRSLFIILFFLPVSPIFADSTIEGKTYRAASTALAKSAARDKRMSRIVLRAGPNFSGRWAGRYVLGSRNCDAPFSSFLFRHIFSQSGGRATLQTTHDGTFSMQSRDKGRRFEGGKSGNGKYGPYNVAIVYKNLSKDGRVSGTGYGVSVGGCTYGFGANAIRQ